jgi:hypothetical protein
MSPEPDQFGLMTQRTERTIYGSATLEASSRSFVSKTPSRSFVFETIAFICICKRLRSPEIDSASLCSLADQPVFLNVYGAQELTPRNEFRQPM